jgi:hypothetical protein
LTDYIRRGAINTCAIPVPRRGSVPLAGKDGIF